MIELAGESPPFLQRYQLGYVGKAEGKCLLLNHCFCLNLECPFGQKYPLPYLQESKYIIMIFKIGFYFIFLVQARRGQNIQVIKGLDFTIT